MVITRNQMILDLTTPLTEKYAYKNPSQRKDWGHLLIIPKFYLIILKRVLGEYFS